MHLRIDGPELPKYVSHKEVWALEISGVGRHQMTDGVSTRELHFRDDRYVPILAPIEMFSRYEPVEGDFLVVYSDGYKSFSPRKAFIEGYARAGT